MRFLCAILFVPLAFLLTFVSIPWLIVAMGYEMAGDDERYEAALDHAPLSRWFDWRDGRRGT